MCYVYTWIVQYSIIADLPMVILCRCWYKLDCSHGMREPLTSEDPNQNVVRHSSDKLTRQLQ